jgi:hypothetical protein
MYIDATRLFLASAHEDAIIEMENGIRWNLDNHKLTDKSGCAVVIANYLSRQCVPLNSYDTMYYDSERGDVRVISKGIESIINYVYSHIDCVSLSVVLSDLLYVEGKTKYRRDTNTLTKDKLLQAYIEKYGE